MRRTPFSYLAVLAALACAPESFAATPSTVTTTVDDAKTVALPGNTRPEARLTNDRGALPGDFALDHLQLLLKRPPETEAALARFVESLQDPSSPNYHRWLTASEFGTQFGPSDSDIAAVTSWLTAHGFTVNGIAPGRMTIDFSGTAAQVTAAFHTEVHRLSVRGVNHIANMSDPRIPAALAGAVSGVVSLNDFRPHTNFKKSKPSYTISGGYYLVVPADLATIYNLNPLFTAGITGTGQTIVVIEDTNVYSTADWTKFRSTFGLSAYTSGKFTQVHPAGSNACGNPGVVLGDEGEAELDAEWASAAAPNAAIELAACADTVTNFGGLLALQNLLELKSPPAVVSMSYGECEAENGAVANAAYNSTYEQAVSEGVSVFVSAGDEGAASCDADQANATHGIGVSGFASTPYNVAVGGTDFEDAYLNETAAFWGLANKAHTYESAKSYIPEIPWNDSCASGLIADAAGFSTTYGSSGFCNSATAYDDGNLTTAAGSGGPSHCATGAPTIPGVVSGTCKGYAKPSWQSLLGVPSDGVRDIPDVSLFAANGVWGHYYVYCDSDINDDGASCAGAPSTWSGAGGTSFASPILAGIQALVNQKTGARQGNPNPVYYQLAATEYGTAGSATCTSRRGKTISGSCVFNDITNGDSDVNCSGSNNCYTPSGYYGVLSTSSSTLHKAYNEGLGWDFATGIGSLNAANLVANWPMPVASELR